MLAAPVCWESATFRCDTWRSWTVLTQNCLPSCRTAAMPASAGIARCADFAASARLSIRDFSLLTANLEVLRHPVIVSLAEDHRVSPAQVIFAFARAVGMLPLTGTSSPEHMRQDLGSATLDAYARICAGDRKYSRLALLLFQSRHHKSFRQCHHVDVCIRAAIGRQAKVPDTVDFPPAFFSESFPEVHLPGLDAYLVNFRDRFACPR